MIRIRSGPRRPIVFAAGALALLLGSVTAFAAPPRSPSPAGAASTSAPTAPATPAGRPASPSSTPAAAGGEEASNHFKRGLQLFDEGDYTLALVEFERAYQLAPNYRALYNIALVNMQLGRYADAARTFEKYLHDGGSAIAPARLAEVNKTLAELKLRTATVDITTSVSGAEVTLDGKPLDLSALHGPMEIDAGEHTLRATAPGYGAANRTVTLAGGDKAVVRLDLALLATNRPEAPARVHTIFWPGFAATAALAAGAIVSGVIMLDERSHLNQLQSMPSDPSTAANDASQRASTANRANTAALSADVFTGLAVVAGGVSLYLSLGPDHPAKSPSIAIGPQKVALAVPF
jgi:PEGA domain/Tetratricopeptide repeat